MMNPAMGPTRPWIYPAVAAVTIASAAALGWAFARKRRRTEQLRQIAKRFGNEDLNPDRVSERSILVDLQATWGLDGTGQWNRETAALVESLAKTGKPPGATTTNPAHAPADPNAELEPDADWEPLYEARIESAVAQAKAEPNVVTFDQAVLYVLTFVFPEAGPFQQNPGTGAWKRQARERARHDIAARVGHTEAEARAVLNAETVGASAVGRGVGVGQAVRMMGEYAFPTARWGNPDADWQRLFSERAAAELGSIRPPVG